MTAFKLQVVHEVESRELGRTKAYHKYVILVKSTIRE